MKRKIIYFLLALAVVMPASAQKFFKDAIYNRQNEMRAV